MIVESNDEMNELWNFYEEAFRPLNEKTPIAQTWSKEFFVSWLKNESVVKFIVKKDGKIAGLGIVTTEIKLDWLLSPLYFKKHFPSKTVAHFPVIAIADHLRNTKIIIKLLRMMINEVPEDGLGVFFHSKMFSSIIPRLANIAGKNYIEGGEIDTKACCIYKWRKKIDLLAI